MGLPLDLSGDLSQASLLSLVGAGFLASLLHAVLPTHWLPFVAVGRAQGWSTAITLTVTVLAGLAHIASTAIVGSLLTLAGGGSEWRPHRPVTARSAVASALRMFAHLWRA